MTLSATTGGPGSCCIDLPAACVFDTSKWQSASLLYSELTEERLGAFKSWSLRVEGQLIKGRFEGFYEPGGYAFLFCKMERETDHFTRMRFDEDMIHVSFMLEPDLYRIEKLNEGALSAANAGGGPYCFLLRFAKGQESLWWSRATNGSTKIDFFLPSRRFERFYGVKPQRYPPALRRLTIAEPTQPFPPIPMTPEILECLDQMTGWHRASPIRGAFLRAKVQDLMCAIWFAAEHEESTLARRARANSRDQEILARACRYVRKDLGSSLTIPKIARSAGTNRNKLNDIFQAFLSETVFKYVQRVRLEQARAFMVRDNTRSISELSFAVGYTNATSFARAYQKHFGRAPSKDFKRSRSWSESQPVSKPVAQS